MPDRPLPGLLLLLLLLPLLLVVVLVSAPLWAAAKDSMTECDSMAVQLRSARAGCCDTCMRGGRIWFPLSVFMIALTGQGLGGGPGAREGC